MKKIRYIYGVIIFTVLTTSCKKDFLNQLPVTSTTTENVYKTSDDFYAAIVGSYSTLKKGGLYGVGAGSMISLGEVTSDNSDVAIPRSTSTVDIFELEDFNFSLTNGLFSSAWTDHYAGIGRVNIILDKLPGASFDASLKTRFEAEAKFLRALFYFDLVRLFGGVQLTTSSISDPSAANNLPRSSASQIYALIISDLTFAEANLPATIPATEAGRASKWAAKALLGKVYLTMKDYTNAATKLNEVITSNQFNVTMNTYAAVFSSTTSFANNKDVIFSVQYVSGQIGQGTQMSTITLPQAAATALFGLTGGSAGQGWMRPTPDMIGDYESGDLRKQASVATSYANGATTVNELYVTKYLQPGSVANDGDVDFPVLRYADVLLMYAEALNEQGQTAQALTSSAVGGPVNSIRKRAGLADLPVTLSQTDARLAIEHERRIELAFEGHRWFDLIRTGRYMTVMNGKGYATKAFNNLFPIPFRETSINVNLKQNPGY